MNGRRRRLPAGARERHQGAARPIFALREAGAGAIVVGRTDRPRLTPVRCTARGETVPALLPCGSHPNGRKQDLSRLEWKCAAFAIQPVHPSRTPLHVLPSRPMSRGAGGAVSRSGIFRGASSAPSLEATSASGGGREARRLER